MNDPYLMHTKPTQPSLHFSCCWASILALLKLGSMFGLALNNAVTHAKKKNLTFVISLLRPICSCQARRKANVWEEKTKTKRFKQQIQSHLSNIQEVPSFLLIMHQRWNELQRTILYWSQGLRTSYSTNSAVGFSAGWIIVMSDNVSAVSLPNDGEQREKRAWRLDMSHQGNVKKKKKVCSCHITTNMPWKSFAVSKYTQLVTNT